MGQYQSAADFEKFFHTNYIPLTYEDVKSDFETFYKEQNGKIFHEDYEKAGFFMLPTGKRDNGTALQIILYTIWLIIASLLPMFGYTGQLFLSPVAAVLVFLIGLWMLFYAVKVYQIRTAKAARTLMLVSVSYITLLQIIYIVDKFLR